MNAEEILSRLTEIEKQTTFIMNLFDKNTRMPQEKIEESQFLLQKLKEDLSIEYKRMGTVRGEKSLSQLEANFYHPAIRDAWANSCLSSLKWNSRPDGKWFSVLYDVSGYMSYWKENLLSAQAA
jgi:hypothetical protein